MAGREGRCAPDQQSHLASVAYGKREALAHEIRARAIACTSLGCIGHVIRCGRCRKERRLLFLCATVASSFVPRAMSSLTLIRSHKRVDALEQEVIWVSTSGAGIDVGGPASAVQVRDGVLSPRDEVVITTRGNGILSVRAVRASRFSRAPLECSPIVHRSLQAGCAPRSQLGQNGIFHPTESGFELCVFVPSSLRGFQKCHRRR